MATNLHSCVAEVPARIVTEVGKAPVEDKGLFHCESYGCAFRGDIYQATRHTIENQPNLIAEDK